MSLSFIEIFAIVIAVCLCALVSLAWHIHRQHQKYDHLPGPTRDSFWSGNLPSIQKVIADGGILDDYLLQMSKIHGLLFRIYFWNQALVIVLDPEYIKDVLVTGNHPKSKRLYSKFVNLFGTRFAGQGLESVIDRKLWASMRTHLDQWFKPHHIRQKDSEFNEFADRYIEQLEKNADGKTEIHTLNTFNKLTMFLLCKLAFNLDMGPLGGKNHPFLANMRTALSGLADALQNPLLAVNPFKWRYRQSVRKAINFLRDHAQQEISERNVAKTKGDYIPRDLLEYILELKEDQPSIMTDEILVDNFLTFLVAGQETSANTLSFILSLLGQNPKCYQKLQSEIDENIGAVSVINVNELEKLPYLDMIFKETLRIYPVAKVTFRETTKGISMGSYLIPEGTDMCVSFYATSRAEQNFTNPTEFLPERFDGNSSEKFSRYAYTPFSAGPHTCIGKKFAEIEIKLVIAKIMQNFDFELSPGQSSQLIDNVLVQAKDGVKCFFRPRRTVSA